MLHALGDDRADVLVRERVKHAFALPPAFDELAALENAQLMGDRGGRHLQSLGQVADADLRLEEDKKDADARGVAEDLEELGEVEQTVLVRERFGDEL